MFNCILYSFDDVYNQNVNSIRNEVAKGNIRIVGISGSSKIKSISYVDGYSFIDRNQIKSMLFDFLIIFNGQFDVLKKSFLQEGIDEKKIIDGRVFSTPCFDFRRYASLVKDPLTVFSDDCWGGQMLHYLGLKFYSPFVNLHLDKNDYLKFLENPDYYLNEELVCGKEGDMYTCQCPIGFIGKDENKIAIIFNHHSNFESAKSDWDRRKDRVNWNNVFVKMVTDKADENLIKRFDKLSFKKKIVFSPKQYDQYESCVYLRRYIELCNTDAIHFGSNTFSSYIRRPAELAKSIDLLALFSGEENYIRER